ncbi:MAG: hypothetical protein KYX62_07140 [Pseudomonadota bacterium]|nr:hypothetical protein [Pseudomonadota bacterium]
MSKPAPGTSGLMPVKGSGCGIRPDPDAFPEDTGFDFSAAAQLRPDADKPPQQEQQTVTNKDVTDTQD